MMTPLKTFVVLSCVLVCAVGCAPSPGDAQMNATAPNTANPAANNTTASNALPAATPSNKLTSADVSKLKWIEGTWRGMDGDEPFYERYRFDGTSMIVETLKEDGSLDGKPGIYELKDGEFGRTEGDRGSAVSEITDTSVQFVPTVAGKGNKFRFVKTATGWDAILEWPVADNKPAQQKIYKMEPWQPKK